MSLYTDLIQAGIEVDNHATDLYFRDTQQARDILARHPLQESNATRFPNEAPPNVGQMWVDVPFAYDPAWPGYEDRHK